MLPPTTPGLQSDASLNGLRVAETGMLVAVISGATAVASLGAKVIRTAPIGGASERRVAAGSET